MMTARWAGTRPSAARCSSRSHRRPPIASPAPLLGSPAPVVDGSAAPSTTRRSPPSSAACALASPIGLAAGFDKTCAHLGALGSLGFGYVVGGTITRAARAGNAKPRIARSPATRSMVNAMGLPNPGAEVAAQHLERDRRGAAPRFVSIADEAVDDAVSSLDLLAPHADAIELNASCPNVSWGRDRDNEAHLRDAGRRALRARTSMPVDGEAAARSSPVIEREVVLSLARVAQEAGAHALTCSNTRPVADTRLAIGAGGLSGKALWPHTARIVRRGPRGDRWGESPSTPCGGVFTAEDALTCLQAGATTVQVYSGLIYEGPAVASVDRPRPRLDASRRGTSPFEPRRNGEPGCLVLASGGVAPRALRRSRLAAIRAGGSDGAPCQRGTTA